MQCTHTVTGMLTSYTQQSCNHSRQIKLPASNTLDTAVERMQVVQAELDDI